jgi:hypothetical protein
VKRQKCKFRRYLRSKTKINRNLFCILLTYSYLCTRFPRNRCQEVTCCLLCCVGTIQQFNKKRNGSN